jgi:hypothetical protein
MAFVVIEEPFAIVKMIHVMEVAAKFEKEPIEI